MIYTDGVPTICSPERVGVEVEVSNEMGDTRHVVGYGADTNEAILNAVNWANEHNPPAMWPVGVPHGTWALNGWRAL